MGGAAAAAAARTGGEFLDAWGDKRYRETVGKAGLQDRYRYDVLNQQQFDPMAPYRRLHRGALYSAFARAWGLDKILGSDFLDHLSDRSNYPGTSAIGGGENLKGPPEGIPEGKIGGGWLNVIGRTLKAAGGSGMFGGGGG